ncbi:hypothetical protein [Aeromonas phage AS-yj]|uniref:Uncharacterized protein n=7 Tax=Caudoviricetes TaxID=2731619 RepID=A0A291LDC9_9CAUD|nr:hypothetical protein F485_gp025 [Aeromonas phage CC2]YP_009834610.1 hypothetical protein HWB28_gp310 [Aeromonas phage AS-zj]YP_009834843.1 hypothetical protein HWB29_gp141 [Aeromonas phage AS-sw]ATI17351.1 hypothetical protein [Aeromonas phage AS-szw]ATI17743.1 hypothetical protein [Aeromonas phage AS-yj]QAX97796.1 hypothetical protein ASswx1_151 [Aeromonas phage Asswx_1]UKM62830.1 hypothetical protein P19_0342 [Aeromonas phage P19]AFN39286.1 hypothetical protein CC2_386 [Aeromonas phage 
MNPVAKHNFNRPSVMKDKKENSKKIRGKKHKKSEGW